MQWYVVRTHVNKEFFAAQNLIKQNIITYFPKYKKIKIHARKRSIIIKALFPRYIFIQINLENQNWSSINYTYGVNNIITMNNKPAKIPETIINRLKNYENNEGLLDINQFYSRSVGEEVNIIEGVFRGNKAIFKGLEKDKRIKVLLKLLGKEVTLSYTPMAIL